MFDDNLKKSDKKGKYPVYKGNPKKWQVLDDDFFSADQKKQTQRNIYDNNYLKTLNEDSALSQKKEQQLMTEEEEDTVPLPFKNKYID